MQPRLVSAIVAVFMLAGQQAAVARPSAAAREQVREREAKKACLSGDYQKGVSILAELYVETDDPVFLHNQGRCYEQNVRYVEAAERFREYLRKAPKLTREERAQVDQHIADCEAAAARNQARGGTESPTAPAQPAQVSPQVGLVPLGSAQTVVQPTDSTTVVPPPSSQPTTGRSWHHTAQWVATGVGVAFLGLGVVEHLRYYTKNRDYNNDPNCGVAGQCKDLADAADTAKIVTVVGYGAAAVAFGLAITFWLTDSPRAPAAQHAGASCVCAPTVAGVTCGGRF
jgi:hypothetical protein